MSNHTKNNYSPQAQGILWNNPLGLVSRIIWRFTCNVIPAIHFIKMRKKYLYMFFAVVQTFRILNQMISAGKYQYTFSRQIEAIVHVYLNM